MHTILILGGYGFFGARIAAALAADTGIRLLIGGRNAKQAMRLCIELGLPGSQGLALDVSAPGLAATLAEQKVDTVIHTAGPFQGQDYTVARAAIEAGAHYIDLADGRDFVRGICSLDPSARHRGVLATSGASSLPALSSAVVDHYLPRFSRLDSIRHAIASGARAPGLATMRGVFGYCGKPFLRLEDGRWKTVYGWLDAHAHRFPEPVGLRWLGSCDVPDLDLFPSRYKGVKTVIFHAGFAGAAGHWAVWAGALLVRFGVLRSLAPFAPALRWLSQRLEPLLSDKGAMFVEMSGADHAGHPLTLVWNVIAMSNHGPYIPCAAAIALARKLARGDSLPSGAMPCEGLLSVEEYLAALGNLEIREIPA